MQNATNVFVFDEPGKSVFLGELDFVAAFAKLGRDELKSQSVIDLLLGLCGNQLAPAKQAFLG